MTKYVNGSTTVDIQYDARGFRRSSTKVKGTTTSNREFIYSDDGRLLYDRINTFERYYLYGQDGIVGFEEDGVVYTYRKNLFGDVTAIYQGTTKVAEYVYDAWGNCTITTNVNGFGTRNAIRYRGYYWDNDLNMYYLMTRYYDPQIGRFINTDTPDYLDPKTINGLNLYAYCNNNPVMNVDPSGHEPLSASVAIWLLAGCYALIFTAMYFVAKNTPPSEPKHPDDGPIHGRFKGPDADIISPDSADYKGTNGYGLSAYLCKGSLFFDTNEYHSIYAALGVIDVYGGIDVMKGIGIMASASAAEIGYDGRILDASVQGLTVGLSLMYANGQLKAGYGCGWYGVSVSIDFGEILNIILEVIGYGNERV